MRLTAAFFYERLLSHDAFGDLNSRSGVLSVEIRADGLGVFLGKHCAANSNFGS